MLCQSNSTGAMQTPVYLNVSASSHVNLSLRFRSVSLNAVLFLLAKMIIPFERAHEK